MKLPIERAVSKIAYELRFVLGLEDVKDDEVRVNGHDFLDVYLDLYGGEDQARFRKLIRKALISPHCERYFKKLV